MLLTIHERAVMPTFLPAKDSFERLLLRKDILDKTQFTPEEVEKYKIDISPIEVKWETNAETEIKFSGAETSYVADQLMKLSDENKLGVSQVSLYERFVLGKNPVLPIEPAPENKPEEATPEPVVDETSVDADPAAEPTPENSEPANS